VPGRPPPGTVGRQPRVARRPRLPLDRGVETALQTPVQQQPLDHVPRHVGTADDPHDPGLTGRASTASAPASHLHEHQLARPGAPTPRRPAWIDDQAALALAPVPARLAVVAQREQPVGQQEASPLLQYGDQRGAGARTPRRAGARRRGHCTLDASVFSAACSPALVSTIESDSGTLGVMPAPSATALPAVTPLPPRLRPLGV